MCTDDTSTWNDSTLYDRVIHDNISRFACDCLLVMRYVVENLEANDQSYDAGNTQSIRQLIEDFLIKILGGPMKRAKKEVGLVESSAIAKLSRSLNIPKRKSGLQYSIRTNLELMVTNLNNCGTYGRGIYSINPQLIEKVFASFASQLEDALEAHLTQRTGPVAEDTSLIDAFSSLSMETERNGSSVQPHLATAENVAMQIKLQRPSGFMTEPIQSRSTTTRGCFHCRNSGHFVNNCPQIKCYRCM
jgi:hypothetical protein